jgi:subtilisin family serine protease
LLLVYATVAVGQLAYIPEQVIVRFEKAGTLADATSQLYDSRMSAEENLVPSLDIFLVKLVPQLSVEDALNDLRKNPRIKWAQADHFITQRTTFPNDPLFGLQWGMNQTSDVDIDAPEAWDYTTGGTMPGGQDIVVAVVDDGCQISHPDLAPNLWTNTGEIADNGVDDDGNGYIDDVHGWNALNQNGTITVGNHGTHVTGIVGARGSNGRMVCGVNYAVKLLPVVCGSTATSVVSRSYNYVLTQKNRWWSSGGTQGANVVSTNSSFGVDSANCASGDFPIWNDLYNSMGAQGILSAVATANRNWNIDITGDVPSACSSSYIISVTNTTSTDQRNSGAAYGATTIDLGAPGTGIFSTIPTDTAAYMSGTSMATPHVAGAIAFLHAAANLNFYNYYMADRANASLTLKQLILSNVDVIPALTGITVSNGRLNLYNAARALRHYGGPPNDECPGIAIASLPYTYNGTTGTAVNDFFNCVGVNSPDAIFSLALACTTSVTVSLCGSSYDTGLDIRMGGSGCPGGASIACNDDACGLQSQLTFTAQPNVTYYIVVHGYGTNSGAYTLNVSGVVYPPVNDQCPGRSISSLPYSDSGNTFCGNSDDNTKCVGATTKDVFYTMNLASCQTVTVSLCGSGYDTGLEVRANGSCPGSVVVACNDDYCSTQSQVTFTAQSGVNYYLIVHGYGSQSGPFVMNVSGTPFLAPNDNCPGTVITGLPYADYGNTLCATHSVGNCQGSDLPPDVIYPINLASCQTVTATLCGSGYDTEIQVRTNGGCPGETIVACNDDQYCGQSWSLQSTVTFEATKQVTYWIIVSGYGSSSGAYALYISGVPSAPDHDLCPGRTVTGMPYTDTGNTTCANNNYFNCVQGNAPEVVYTFNTPICREVTVSLCGSSYDTGLEVRTDGACPGATMVACEDDSYCNELPTATSVATFRANANQDYFFVVHGYSAEAGAYVLNVTAEYCHPTGLVIHAVPPRIYLHWDAVPGVSLYSVYRDSLPDVAIIETNHIGDSDSTGYLDLTVLDLPATKFFYAVTAVIPQLLAKTGEKQKPRNEKVEMRKEDAAKPSEVYLPAYSEGNTRLEEMQRSKQ